MRLGARGLQQIDASLRLTSFVLLEQSFKFATTISKKLNGCFLRLTELKKKTTKKNYSILSFSKTITKFWETGLGREDLSVLFLKYGT